MRRFGSRRYHFPNRYLADAQSALGDWIVYREPRRGGGRKGYVAVARVVRIDPDPATPGHSYAWVADYLPFDTVVPLRKAQGFYETLLDRVANSAYIGAALQGKSIRAIPDADFGAITRAGLHDIFDPHNAARLLDPGTTDEDVLDLINAPPAEQERRIAQYLANRKIRDAAFRKAVCDAYDNRCVVTGLRIINGGGRAEVQAAHVCLSPAVARTWCRTGLLCPPPSTGCSTGISYEARLRERVSLTVWFTNEAIAAWAAAPRTSRGDQRYYGQGPVGRD